MMSIEFEVSFRHEAKGRKTLEVGPKPEPIPGRVPRVARLLALAIRMEGLIRSGAVKDFSQLADLGHVTRARITQIMNLTLLAPDIQEAILFMQGAQTGRNPIRLCDLQPIALQLDWGMQRRMWKTLVG